MAKKTFSFDSARRVELAVAPVTKDATLHFVGEEDSRFIVLMNKAAADGLADQLFAAGYGAGVRT